MCAGPPDESRPRRGSLGSHRETPLRDEERLCSDAIVGVVQAADLQGQSSLFVHPETGKEIWVTVHGHDAGRLGNSQRCWGGIMAMHYPIVFEREDSGVVSAHVAGLRVYAPGPTRG